MFYKNPFRANPPFSTATAYPAMKTLFVLAFSILLLVAFGGPAPELSTTSRSIYRCSCWGPYNICRNHILRTCYWVRNGKYVATFVKVKGRWMRKCSIREETQVFRRCLNLLNNCLYRCRLFRAALQS